MSYSKFISFTKTQVVSSNFINNFIKKYYSILENNRTFFLSMKYQLQIFNNFKKRITLKNLIVKFDYFLIKLFKDPNLRKCIFENI